MTLLRKSEVALGIATALAGLLNLCVMWTAEQPRGVFTMKDSATAIIFWLGPPFLLACGAYAHASRQARWGKIILWLSALFLTAVGGLTLLGTLYYKSALGLPAASAGALALAALLVSFAVERDGRRPASGAKSDRTEFQGL